MGSARGGGGGGQWEREATGEGGGGDRRGRLTHHAIPATRRVLGVPQRVSGSSSGMTSISNGATDMASREMRGLPGGGIASEGGWGGGARGRAVGRDAESVQPPFVRSEVPGLD